MSDVSARMRADWNQRAREDAAYYVAFGARGQDDAAFLETAVEVLRAIEPELRRFPPGTNPRSLRALEIGCGPGRLLKPLSPHFGEIHGVDVSDEMVRLARERLRGIPHAHVHATAGAGLEQFNAESFDFVYSYAVFQHIPSRDVVLEYLRETVRVLKPGGIFRAQFNSLPQSWRADTWSGVTFTADEIRAICRRHALRLLALEGGGTQYLWTTWQKPSASPQAAAPVLRKVSSARSSGPLVPARGRHAAAALWVEQLPADCDLNSLQALFDGAPGSPSYIAPPTRAGIQQVNVWLPHGVRTGIVPLDILWGPSGARSASRIRVVPPGPFVPRIVSVTDGINIVQADEASSGTLKVHLEEVADPSSISVLIAGRPVTRLEMLCTDPIPPRFELNCFLPEGLPPGAHPLQVMVGQRRLLPWTVRVA